MSGKTVELLQQALWGVVNEPGGTGYAARIDGADVCGKTGTSQVVGLPQDEQARRRKKIAAFSQGSCVVCLLCPRGHPEIVVSVVAKHAGGGGAVAAPITRRILKAYFDGKKKETGPLKWPSGGEDGRQKPWTWGMRAAQGTHDRRRRSQRRSCREA